MKPDMEALFGGMRGGRERVPSWVPVVPAPSHKDFATLEDAIGAKDTYEAWIKANTLWRCTSQTATGKGCGMRNVVNATDAIQTHWYVSPYSCNGGDYWKQGELILVCPCCGKRNRLYASPELTALKPFYKSVKDEYDKC